MPYMSSVAVPDFFRSPTKSRPRYRAPQILAGCSLGKLSRIPLWLHTDTKSFGISSPSIQPSIYRRKPLHNIFFRLHPTSNESTYPSYALETHTEMGWYFLGLPSFSLSLHVPGIQSTVVSKS
jgi:hypothetical protein